MVDSNGLKRRDVDRLMRLLGEAHTIGLDGGKREAHALRGMRELLGACAAVRCRVTGCPTDLHFDGAVCDGLTPAQRRMVDAFAARPEPADPTVPLIAALCEQKKAGEVVVVRRRDLLDDEAWYTHAHVSQVRRKLGLDSFVYAIQVVKPGVERHMAGLFRAWGEEPFGPREAALLELFWRHAAVLLGGEVVRPSVESEPLPARLAEVLGHLHAGRSTKEIARLMDLSPHTVYDHIKRLHRRFNANSRTELVAATQHLKK